jgi:hypothetical protein
MTQWTVLNCFDGGSFGSYAGARLVAVRAPVPFVLPALHIEHDHAPVAVSVRDVHLGGRSVFPHLRGLPEILDIVAAVVDAVLAQLEEKQSGAAELQNLRVFLAVACQPDVPLAVDRDAVIAVGPVVALAWTAPGFHQRAGLVVDEHGRRHLAALADRAARCLRRRSTRSGFIIPAAGVAHSDVAGLEIVFDCIGPVDGPDVVLRINRQADGRPRHPMIRQRLRPERIDLENRRVFRAALRQQLTVSRGAEDQQRRRRHANARCPRQMLCHTPLPRGR